MRYHFKLSGAVVVALLCAAAVRAEEHRAPTSSADTPSAKGADNTATNAVDRDRSTVTPVDQSNDSSALRTTADIRRAVLNDKSLSTSAHNVKIITNGSAVTLRGAVASAAEKERIDALARQIAAGKQVHNEISVSSG